MIRKTVIIIGIIFILSGCIYKNPYRHIKKDEIIENDYISFKAPDTSWRIWKEYETHIHKSKGKPDELSRNRRLSIDNNSINGTSYDIVFDMFPGQNGAFTMMFFKKDNFEKEIKGMLSSEKQLKEMQIKYEKVWTTYVKGLRCGGYVYSQNIGGNMYSSMHKSYSIRCGYYDKNKGKRLLFIDYKYLYSFDSTRLQKDKDEKREELISQEDAENGLKKAVKEIVKTIQIKNLDIEKMESEGLMFYDKEFETTKW